MYAVIGFGSSLYRFTSLADFDMRAKVICLRKLGSSKKAGFVKGTGHSLAAATGTHAFVE